MLCPTCQTINPDTALTCQRCGSPLASMPSTPAAVAANPAPIAPPSGNNRRWIIITLVTIIGLAIAGGGAWAGWQWYVHQQPEYILPQAWNNFHALKAASFKNDNTLTIKAVPLAGEETTDDGLSEYTTLLKPEGETVTLAFDGYFNRTDPVRPTGRLNVAITGNNEYISNIGIESRLLPDLLYIKITELSPALREFIQDIPWQEWIEIDLNAPEFQEYNSAENKEARQKAAAAFKEHALEALMLKENKGVETLEGADVYRYVLAFDRDGLDALKQALAAAAPDDAWAASEPISDEEWKIFEPIALDVWIAKEELLPVRFAWQINDTSTVENVSVTYVTSHVLTFSGFDAIQAIEAPADSISWQELWQEAGNILRENTLNEQSFGIFQLQASLDSMWYETGSYPIAKHPIMLGRGDFQQLCTTGFVALSAPCPTSYLILPEGFTLEVYNAMYQSADGSDYTIISHLPSFEGFPAGGFFTFTKDILGEPITPPTDDGDLDGLSNEKEQFYGTDPNNPDTDSDGYTDGSEVTNGYNPNGEGAL